MLCTRTACARSIPEDAVFCPYCGKKQISTARTGKKAGRAPNGSGTVVKRGSTYTIIYRHRENGRTISRSKGGFSTKANARAYLPSLVKPSSQESQIYTIAKLWEMLQPTRKWQEIGTGKRGHYTTAYNRLSELHNRDIASIRFWELQAIVEDLPGAFYPKRDAKTVLQKLYDLAVINEIIPPSKAEMIRYLELPSKPLTAQDARTPEEMRKIWDDWRSGHDIAGYMLIMAYAGLRTGELTTIDANAVDLSARRIVGGIKTAAGRNREIPIAVEILPVLTSLLPAAKYGLCRYGLDTFYTEHSEMLRRLDIRPLRPYCQRHTCCTRLLEVKPEIPRAVINSIIGHINGKLGDTYGHINLSVKLNAVDSMQMF